MKGYLLLMVAEGREREVRNHQNSAGLIALFFQYMIFNAAQLGVGRVQVLGS